MKLTRPWFFILCAVLSAVPLSCGKPPVPAEAPSAGGSGTPAPSDPLPAAAPEPVSPDPAPAPPESSLQPPAPSPFDSVQARSSFQARLIAGDMGGIEDYPGAIEEWAASIRADAEIDSTITRLEAAAREPAAPPHVSFARAARYGRKGLISKQYAALTQAETAAAARPDLVFALTAVHGRKETLKSRYKAEDLLVGSLAGESEPPGARIHLDGKEIGTSPLRIDKLREGTYTVRFLMSGYDDWELSASVETGRETRVRAPLGAKPGKILVSVEPEAMVSLDGGPAERTPFVFENIPPGEHVLSFASPYVLGGKRFYVTPGDSSVVVKPGESVEFKRTLAVGAAKFKTLNAPAGSSVYIDGKKAERGPDDWIDVESGSYIIAVETPGGMRYSRDVNILPGFAPQFDVTIMTMKLPFRTVALDGKTDSWGPLEPLFESADSAFLGDPAYGIRRFYMCRDDKYLYWRVDFREKNPLVILPGGVKESMETAVIMDFKSRRAHLGLGLSRKVDTRELRASCHVVDDTIGKTEKNLGSATSLSYKLGDTMYVGRVPLSLIEEYLKDVSSVRFAMANQANGRWTGETGTRKFQIDFSR